MATLIPSANCLNEDGEVIESDDFGGVLPDPENFFIWHTLKAGTYYIKVAGYGTETGDYVFRVRTFTDTTRRSNATELKLGGSASGMIDPENDQDYFKLELSETADVILRGSGFPDTYGELLSSSGGLIVFNDDGRLIPGFRNFLIRQALSAGTYYLRVSSFAGLSDGPYSVYATKSEDPGDEIADAVPLTLSDAAGGNLTASDDVDYFSITVDEPTYVRIWTSKNPDDVDTDGVLLGENGDPVPNVDFAHDFSILAGFGIEHGLSVGTYYVKVTADADSGTGKYTIRASEDVLYQRFVDRCGAITGTSGIDDDFYGCQWHLDNDRQFTGGVGEDINVEDVWTGGNLGDGITVAVVDDGMHHQHADLHENVEESKNHDYTVGNEIYDPTETHGTAVAGIIAARDNMIGMRGVAPRARIYGYNLLVSGVMANEANAMSRNAATTAISNNSWGPGDSAVPEPAQSLWEAAVEDGVTTGYGGKGVFYAWAAGNGAREGDYSTLDEYSNFYAVTAVCAVNYADVRSVYSEKGANLWVCGPSNGRGVPGIATTDNGNRYQDSFGGTSAATPMVSGVAALVRKANDALTWRDVKLILAASARKNDASNSGWETGAVKYGDFGNYEFNHEYGFGVVDAAEAVDLADGWTNVPALRRSTVGSGSINLSIPDATIPDPNTNITVPGGTKTSEITLDGHVEFIEYIQVDAHFNHTSFRDLDVELVAPSGNVSKLVPYFDREGLGLGVPVFSLTDTFRFGSAKHLGEDAEGTWTLRVTDHLEADSGTLRSWSVTAYGHAIKPLAPDIDEVYPASGGFTVVWKAPDDTGRSAISAYDVRYIKTSEDDTVESNWTVVDNAWTSGPLQYTASGLTAGEQYDVQVRAVTAEGDSPWSGTTTVTPITAAAPTIESITPGNGTLTIIWAAPTNAGLGTIDSYDLRYTRSSSPTSWTVVDSAWTSGNLEYTISPDPPMSNGVSYDVQVRAVVGTTEHPWSETRVGTPRTVPGAPTVDSVDGDDGKLFVEWTAPSDNGGADVTSYDLRYIKTREDETDDDNWTVETGTSDPAKHSVSNLDNWVQYDVQVRAVNPSGPGAWSATVTGTPINSAVIVTLEWDSTSVDVNENAGSITLTEIATTDRDAALPSDFFFDAMVETAEGTAVDLDDYVPSSTTTLTFNDDDFVRMEVNGQQRYRATMDFTVTVFDDTDDESDETFTAILAYANPDIDNLRLRNSITTVTIKDDEHVPVNLGWLDTSVSVNEGRGTVTLDATATTTGDKRPETGFSFQATVSTSPGSARAADDYTRVSMPVTFQQSDFRSVTVSGDQRYRATQSVSVPIINDTEDERDEDFTVILNYSGPSLPHLQGGPATATVTITDNDFVPVTISWDQSFVSVDEHAMTVTLQARTTTTSDKMPESGFTVALSATTAGDTATEDSDYRRLTNSFSFGQGDFTRTDVGGQFRFQATRDISVTIIDDTDDEPDEDFTVTLSYSNPSLPHLQGGPDTATVTIVDNDHVPVTLGWEETAFTAEEPTSPGTTTPVTLRAMAFTATDKRPESGFTFDFTVNTADGTARQPSDYEPLSVTETFERNNFFPRTTVDGESRWVASRDFTVNVEHDTVNEPLETFRVVLAFVGPSQPYLLRDDMTATVTTTDDIASLVDLRTMVNANASTVEPGEQLTYDWSVSNSGPAASTSTALTGTLDAGTSFVSAQVISPATGQCRRSDQTITCTLGTLDLGDSGSGEVVVEVTGNASADVHFTAIAGADQLDRTPADNDDSVTTELVAAPRQITNLRASGASAHIDVTWSTPGDNGSLITRYELERKEAGESYALVTPGLGGAATTYRDSQVSAGTTYTYQLRAGNADGNAEWSNEATATARETPPPPPPPVIGGGGGGGPPPLGFVEGTSATRSVPENTPVGENVGEPVDATGEDLEYTLTGDDASSFGIVSGTGQLQTGAALDHETKAAHTVTVTATDSSEASATIDVTINVDNVEESGTVTLASDRFTVGETIVATLTDPDGSITETTWLWERSLDKIAWTAIGGATSAEYTPVLEDAGHYLRVTASYADGEGPGKAANGISDEPVQGSSPPMFSEGTSATRSVEENTAASEDIGGPVQATGDGLEYALDGQDAASFDIVPETGQLQTKAALDYETQASHTVTVTATDSSEASATIDVTINVDNVEESGTVTLSSDRFTVGETIVATLTDPDGSITETTWLWERSLDKISWTAIGGATSAEYTPVLEDAGHYLRVTASYADGEGPDKTAHVISGATLGRALNPTGLSAVPGGNPGEVSLSWTPSADAIAHWVWSVRSDGANGRWTTGQAGAAVVSGLEAGITYWFAVMEWSPRADGSLAWSELSNWAQAQVERSPTGLSAEPGDNPGEVSLRWTPSANAIAYWVWSVKDDGSNGRWTAGQAGSAVVGDLEAGVAYWFVVIEELGHRDGASQWSAYSNWDRAMASEQLNPTGVLQMSNNSYRANWSWR